MRDLWGAEGGKAYVKNKQPDPNWSLSSKNAFKKETQDPRKRPGLRSEKNKKEAVPLPHGGQSYHPTDADHQAALKRAAATLERKKHQDEEWVKKRSLNEKDLIESLKKKNKKQKNKDAADGEDASSSDDDSEDYDEPLAPREKAEDRQKMTRSQVLKEKKKNTVAQKAKHGKKLSKSELAERKKHALRLKRQPNQLKKLKDVDRIEEIAAEVGAEKYHSIKLAQFRKELKKKGKITKAFGRHHHQPLAMEVAPTAALTGSLRQLMSRAGNNAAANPVVDRMKSLEARNMVPAKMRHKYNQKKEVIQTGEIKVIKENFGTNPHSD